MTMQQDILPNDAANAVHSQQDTVLFDGECRFCRSQIAILQGLDRWHQLEFVSLHNPEVLNRFPDLSYEQMMEQMWIVPAARPGKDEQKFGGADAVRYLTRTLPLLYPLAPLLHFPGSMPLWRVLYRLVARFRYWIAGRSACEGGTCEYHFNKAKR